MRSLSRLLTWLRSHPLAITALLVAVSLPILWYLAENLITGDDRQLLTQALQMSMQSLLLVCVLISSLLIITVGLVYFGQQKILAARELRRLTELQSQYGLAEDLARLGSWVYHVDEQRYDWSSGSFQVFGIDMDNGVPSSKGFLICIHPEDQQRWKDAHKRAVRKGQDVRIEYRYVKNGKDIIWVRSVARCEKDSKGRVVRLAGIVQDTSSIRAMAQEISRSEAKFRSLSQMSSDWFWETDAEHRLSFLSDSAAAELGDWIRGSIGKTRWEIGEHSIPGTDWNEFKTAMDQKRPFKEFIYSRIDPNGNLLYLSISGSPTYDEKHQFIGYRGVGRNVTREREQKTLLEIDSELAKIMREQSDPERVVTMTMIAVCGLMGWVGAVHIRRVPGTDALQVGEYWGEPNFNKMIEALPDNMRLMPDSVEAKSWSTGKALWLADIEKYPDFGKRYQVDRLNLRSAFLAPIVDESSHVNSSLLMFGTAQYRADRFVGQVAEILSRNLSLYLQRKVAERRLTRASLHDALTGMPNRVFLTHQLETKLKRQEAVAILYVDLDRFKIINDTLGHQVGDQVLIEVTRRSSEVLRPGDVPGRIGGDEFIFLLSNTDDPKEVEQIARSLLAALEKPFIFGGRAYFLSASIGVALAPRDGIDSTLLIKCADSAMYQVKSEGRNDVRFFSGSQSDDRTAQLQLAAELPAAMQRGEVSLHYQPILNIENRRLFGMEALIRWQHPKHGLLLPDRFLPIAEQSNLIREIGVWSIRRAIDDRIALGIDFFPDAPVSVNISAKQLSEEGFLGLIKTCLEEKNFPPHLLRLELSESSFIQDPQRAQGLISGLRELGVLVIIDNFGTGYASLSYIKSLPVDGIKIDQVFIRNMLEDRGNTAIVQAIETLANQMGMKAMAEGVETADELRGLRLSRCTIVQGTFISPPLTIDRLRQFADTLPIMRDLHDRDHRAA